MFTKNWLIISVLCTTIVTPYIQTCEYNEHGKRLRAYDSKESSPKRQRTQIPETASILFLKALQSNVEADALELLNKYPQLASQNIRYPIIKTTKRGKKLVLYRVVPPLIVACEQNKLQVVEKLLVLECTIYCKDSYETPWNKQYNLPTTSPISIAIKNVIENKNTNLFNALFIFNHDIQDIVDNVIQSYGTISKKESYDEILFDELLRLRSEECSPDTKALIRILSKNRTRLSEDNVQMILDYNPNNYDLIVKHLKNQNSLDIFNVHDIIEDIALTNWPNTTDKKSLLQKASILITAINNDEQKSVSETASKKPALYETLLTLKGSMAINLILSDAKIDPNYYDKNNKNTRTALSNNTCPDALKMLLLLGANPSTKTTENLIPLALNIKELFNRKHHITLLCATPLTEIRTIEQHITDKKITVFTGDSIWFEKILKITREKIPNNHFETTHNVLPEELLAVAFAHGTASFINKACEHVSTQSKDLYKKQLLKAVLYLTKLWNNETITEFEKKYPLDCSILDLAETSAEKLILSRTIAAKRIPTFGNTMLHTEYYHDCCFTFSE